MVFWCIIIIVLGFFAILQDAGIITTFGAPYRSLTWIIMLVALGILIRIRSKEENAEKERLKAQVKELQRKLKQKQDIG